MSAHGWSERCYKFTFKKCIILGLSIAVVSHRVPQTALPAHLGQGHRVAGEDTDWAQGRDSPRHCGESNCTDLLCS